MEPFTKPRTDAYVFVLMHEKGNPKDALTQLELGRVPLVGELLFYPPDLCLEVTRVIHLSQQTIRSFPQELFVKLPKVGVNAAWVEVTKTSAFQASELGRSVDQ